MLHKGTLFGGIAILAAALTACPSTPTPGGIDKVTVAAPSGSLIPGGTTNLNVTVARVSGDTTTVTTFTCTSSNTAVATVAVSGNACAVTGVAAGDAIITATSTANSAKKGTANVTVIAATSKIDAGNDGTSTVMLPDGWTADTVGSVTCSQGNSTLLVDTDAAHVYAATGVKAAPVAVYQSEHYCSSGGTMTWNTTGLAAGTYVVRLHFSENYAPNGTAGARTFNVAANGGQAVTIDIFAEAGALYTGVTKDLTGVTVAADGNLSVTFTPTVGDATVAGIELYKVG